MTPLQKNWTREAAKQPGIFIEVTPLGRIRFNKVTITQAKNKVS